MTVKDINCQGMALRLLLISILFITGCSQINKAPPSSVVKPKPVTNQQQAWQQRQAFLTRKTNWTLDSKVSFRFDEENLIFKLNWAQMPANNYIIQINNPITGGLVSKLSRKNSVVSLLADNGRTYRDNDEERLLQNQSGLRIPVKGLQHWVRGLNSPQYKIDQLLLDNAGRPRTLQQAGWNISYASYVNNGTNALPRKINLSRGADKIFIRVIAKSWK